MGASLAGNRRMVEATQLDLWTAMSENRAASRLLADLPRSRFNDPETSHEAADRIKASGALTRQQHEVLDAIRRWPSLTAPELARKICEGTDRDVTRVRFAVSRRAPELVPIHVRRGKPRVCAVNGTPMTTWLPVTRP